LAPATTSLTEFAGVIASVITSVVNSGLGSSIRVSFGAKKIFAVPQKSSRKFTVNIGHV
jgi:hypothetical protein